jgi:hypothetical protein
MKTTFWCYTALLALLLLVGTSVAQNAGTGAIAGVISDSRGAVVPDATIKVTNQANGAVRSARTTSSGAYAIQLLEPGLYVIEVSKQSFKDSKYDQIMVKVTETYNLNITLQVGSIGETVQVTSTGSDLQTENASVGQVTEGKVVEALPLATRNYTQIVALNPGISNEVADATALGRGYGGMVGLGTISAAGAQGIDNSVAMNGQSVNDLQQSQFFSGGFPIPNPDTIEEFKVQTVTYDAAYGHAGGAHIDVITKGGSNSFHGGVFEFFRNTALNANSYFSNLNHQPRPVLLQNQFGFTLGGPVVKNKVTFFTSYQGTRQRDALDPACSTGQFFGPALTDTNRTRAGLGALLSSDPTFDQQNGFGGIGVAPDGSNISNQALALLNLKLPGGQFLIPSAQTILGGSNPETAGANLFSTACPFTENQFMTNVDWNQSNKSVWRERFFFATSNTAFPFPASIAGITSTSTPGFPERNPEHYRNFSLANDYAFSPHLLNEASIGYNRLSAFFGQSTPFQWSQAGVTVPPVDQPVIPLLAIGSYPAVGGNGQNSLIAQNQYLFQDNLSWVIGRHSLRFGGGGEWDELNYVQQTGFADVEFATWADFLLGLPGGPVANGGNGSPDSNVLFSTDLIGNLNRHWRAWDWNAYVQDDIKVTPRFTFNVGLRMEWLGGLGEPYGLNENFDFARASHDAPTPTLAGYVVPSNYRGIPPAGVTVERNGSLPYAGDRQLGFNPRLGFAWQLPRSDRFVLRGGYGMYHEKLGGQPWSQTGTLAPWSQNRFFQEPDLTWSNPIPASSNVTFPDWSNGFYQAGSNLAVLGFSDNFHPPLVQHFGLNLQTKVASGTVFEIGYIGTRGTGLLGLRRPNQAPLASAANPIRGQTTNTFANIFERQPFLGLSRGSSAMFGNLVDSWYNALAASLSKTFTHNVQFLGSYTWARSLTNAARAISNPNGGPLVGNAFDFHHSQNWGPDSFVRPHRFVFSGVYNFPALQGESRYLRDTLGGWSLSGVFTIQSGRRLTATDTNSHNVFGVTRFGGDLAQLSGACSAGQFVTRGSVQSKLNNYFNASCFTNQYPVIGDDGLATGFGNARPGILSGPDQNNVDLAIAKVFPLRLAREGVNLQFRAEAFNAFNHPQFASPSAEVDSSAFGIINSTVVNPRIVQLALKLNF